MEKKLKQIEKILINHFADEFNSEMWKDSDLKHAMEEIEEVLLEEPESITSKLGSIVEYDFENNKKICTTCRKEIIKIEEHMDCIKTDA